MSKQIDFLALLTASAKRELERLEVMKNREYEYERERKVREHNSRMMAEALGRADV